MLFSKLDANQRRKLENTYNTRKSMEFHLICCSWEATETDPGTAHKNRQLSEKWAVLLYPFGFSGLILATICNDEMLNQVEHDNRDEFTVTLLSGSNKY